MLGDLIILSPLALWP